MAERGQRGFEDLECYQLALQVLREAYRVVKKLPPEERYNLAHQMRKAAISVVLNIAEGYGRYHYLDSLRFYYIARGSLDETINHTITAHDLGYIDAARFRELYELGRETERALNGYINYVRRQKAGSETYGDKYILAPGETPTPL